MHSSLVFPVHSSSVTQMSRRVYALTCMLALVLTVATEAFVVPPPLGPPPYFDCDTFVTSAGPVLNVSLMNALLLAHNRVRRNVTPSAVSMPMLRWNEQLAAGAQAYSATCPGITHSQQAHRMNKSLTGFDWVGENLAAGMVFEWGGFLKAVDMWADEGKGFAYVASCDTSAVCGVCVDYLTCGHYEQMVWSNTTDVGCGYTLCNDDPREYYDHYVCWYGRGGNFRGKAPYVAGKSTNLPCGATVTVTPTNTQSATLTTTTTRTTPTVATTSTAPGAGTPLQRTTTLLTSQPQSAASGGPSVTSTTTNGPPTPPSGTSTENGQTGAAPVGEAVQQTAMPTPVLAGIVACAVACAVAVAALGAIVIIRRRRQQHHSGSDHARFNARPNATPFLEEELVGSPVT